MRRLVVLLMLLALGCPWAAQARAEDWPHWLGPTRDNVWQTRGIAEQFPEGGPKIRWRAPLGGGYAGPAVAEGRVYVMDYQTKGGDATPDPNKRNDLDGSERVICLDSATGREIWTHEYACPYKISYPCGPRTTPAVDGDRVYTLGAEGNLLCLNTADGKVIWQHDFKQDYGIEAPQWGFCSHPLIDGDTLYMIAGGQGSTAVAFDKFTGKERWRSLSAKEPGYSAPMLIEAGGRRQLIIWHAESINGLDPQTGETFWSVPLAPDFGMAIMVPRQQGELLFACGIRQAALLLKLATDKPDAEEVWRGTPETALYSVCMTPFIDGETMYGVDRLGQLRGIKLATGERLWETLAPTTGERPQNSGTAFLVKVADAAHPSTSRYVLFNERGDLILADLTPEGYTERSRAHLLEPTGDAFGRLVVWSQPAFAERAVFARNDKEMVCAELGE